MQSHRSNNKMAKLTLTQDEPLKLLALFNSMFPSTITVTSTSTSNPPIILKERFGGLRSLLEGTILTGKIHLERNLPGGAAVVVELEIT